MQYQQQQYQQHYQQSYQPPYQQQYHQQYQQQSTRPSYPQASSPQSMHSTFQSTSSLSSLGSMSTSPTQSHMHSRSSPVLSSAPLPSPSAERQPAGDNYFGAMQSTTRQTFTQPCQQQMQSFPQQPQRQTSNQHQGQRGHGGGMPDTAPFLDGFNLLAEAAKRAEMAVLMRDLDDLEM